MRLCNHFKSRYLGIYMKNNIAKANQAKALQKQNNLHKGQYMRAHKKFYKHTQVYSEYTSTSECSRENSPIIHKPQKQVHTTNTKKAKPQTMNNSEQNNNSVIINIPREIHVTQKPPENAKTTLSIIWDLIKNMFRSGGGKRWSLGTIKYFTCIYLISSAAFYFFTQTIGAPSQSTITRYLKKAKQIDFQTVSDINSILVTMQKYREIYNINDDRDIYGILAVDAISLHPLINIEKDGTVTGLITKYQLSNEEIELIKNSLHEQEKIINKFKKNTIDSAFVYMFAPLEKQYATKVIFIEPSHGAKATTSQIYTLATLNALLRKAHFVTYAYSSDGDSAYRPLVNFTVGQFNDNIPINLNQPIHCIDPLHLLKRVRYRFLSHNFSLVSKNEDTFNYTKLVSKFNLPDVVFDNSKITKMHDSLPLQLFQIQNLYLLYQKHDEFKQEFSYFFPYSIYQAALELDSLTIDERIDYIEIAGYYLKIYQKYLSDKKSDKPAQNKKQQAVLFDNVLINDTLASILTINSILQKYVGKISLNRIGTNPLEHRFGLLRLSSKFKHHFDQVIQVQDRLNFLTDMENELGFSLVKSRKHTFGVEVDLQGLQGGAQRGFTNKDIAIAVLIRSGILPQNTTDPIIADLCWKSIGKQIEKSVRNLKTRQKKHILSSTTFTCSSSPNIRDRQENRMICNEVCSQIESLIVDNTENEEDNSEMSETANLIQHHQETLNSIQKEHGFSSQPV